MTRHEYFYEGKFEFESGGILDRLKLVYHTSGRPYVPGKDNRKVIWICHALTANSDPSDWWPGIVGEGKPYDPEEHFIVCVNMLTSPYGSSGPSSPKHPEENRDNDYYYFDFPKTTVRDIVRANILVRKHLGIEHIDLMIGGSIGGFQVLEWLIMEPEITRRSLISACGARVTPWVTAYNESQRMALEADPTFRQCASLKGGEAGLKCARAIALISYRTYEGYVHTQSETEEDTLFAGRACSYQQYQGKKLIDRFDAYSYYYLSYSLDSHNVGRGRGGVAAALSKIRAKCTIVGIDSDNLFPVEEQKFMAETIPGAVYCQITSKFGHDGFLIESEQLTKIIDGLL